jgi:hypothetical protein
MHFFLLIILKVAVAGSFLPSLDGKAISSSDLKKLFIDSKLLDLYEDSFLIELFTATMQTYDDDNNNKNKKKPYKYWYCTSFLNQITVLFHREAVKNFRNCGPVLSGFVRFYLFFLCIASIFILLLIMKPLNIEKKCFTNTIVLFALNKLFAFITFCSYHISGKLIKKKLKK